MLLYMLVFISLVAGDLRPSSDSSADVLVIEKIAGGATQERSRTQELGAGVLSLWSGLLPAFWIVSCKHRDFYL